MSTETHPTLLPVRLSCIVLLAATGALLGVLLSPAGSRAHNNYGAPNHWFGYNNCYTNSNPCEADNAYHTNCWGHDFNGSGMRDDASYAMRNLANQTNMSKNRISCSSSVDIVWRSGVPSGFDSSRVRGLYRCRSLANSQECDKSQVWINSALLNGQSQTTLNRRKTSCHEVGHSGGNAHSGSSGHYSNHSCMYSGRVAGGHKSYNSHHVSHLNFN